CDGADQLLFTENETNNERIFGTPNATPFVKDGMNNYLVHRQASAINPAQRGTKAAAHYFLAVQAHGCSLACLRLSNSKPLSPLKSASFDSKSFDEVFEGRRKDADAFYATVIPQQASADEANIMRQALAGMLWTKQHYIYDVHNWIGIDDTSVK